MTTQTTSATAFTAPTTQNTPTDSQLRTILSEFSGKFDPTSLLSESSLNGLRQPDSVDLFQRLTIIAKKANLCMSARALGFISTLLITITIWHEAGDNIKLKIIALINFIQRSAFLASNEYLISLIYSYIQDASTKLETPDTFVPTSASVDFDQWSAKATLNMNSWRKNGISAAEMLDKIASNLSGTIDDLYTSQAMTGLQRLFAFAIAKELVGDTINTHSMYLGLAKSKDISTWKGRQDIVPMFSDLLKAVVLIIRSCIGEPDQATFNCNTAMDWLACARWLVQHEHLRTVAGLPPKEGYVADVVWRKHLDTCESKIVSLKIPDAGLKPLVSSLSSKVSDMLVNARCAQYGSRPLPFNIGIVSPPGTGKSTYIADSFIRTACQGLQLNTGCHTLDDYKKLSVTINQADKFMSSYKPASHVACIIDEMGAALATKDNDNQIMTNITNILGEGNWYINRASIQDKGKDLYRPHVNVCISNQEMFGVRNFLSNEALNAFTRRFHVVCDVRVQKDFKKYHQSGDEIISQPGINLDILNNVEDRTSAVEFLIMIPNEAIKGFSPLTGKWISFRQMSDYVRQQSVKHTSKESGLGETRSYLDNVEHSKCPHGYFLPENCDECMRYEPTSEEVVTTPPMPWRERYKFHLKDTFVLIFCSLVCFFTWPFRFFSWVDNKIMHYQAMRQVVLADIYKAQTVADRIDVVLTRYTKYREELVVLRSHGLYLLFGIVSGLVAWQTYSVIRTKSEEKLPPLGINWEKSDIVFTDPLQPKDYFPTAEAKIEGEKPSGELKGNPWDRDDGFIHPGSKSSSPNDVIQTRVKRNLIVGEFHFKDTNKYYRTHLFGVKDQYAIGVWHTLRHFASGNATCTVLRYNHTQTGTHITKQYLMRGTSNLCIRIGPDLGLIKLSDINAFRDIYDHFPAKAQYLGTAATVKGFNMYHSKLQPHNVITAQFEGGFDTVSYKDDLSEDQYRSPVFRGTFDDPHTGHCGTPLISQIGRQTHINGIAVASNFSHNQVCYHIIDQAMIDIGIKHIERSHYIMSPTSSVGYENAISFQEHVDSVVPLDSKSHAYYLAPEDRGSMKCAGKLSTHFGSKMKSGVITYPLAPALFESFPEEYHHNLIAPVFNGTKHDGKWVSPERNALGDLANQVTDINPDFLDAAVKDLVAKFVNISDFEHDRIWDSETCINGQPDTEAKAMPKKTSAGFGEGGKKFHHLEPASHPDHDHYMKLDADAQARFDEMDRLARVGKRSGVIYKTCPKDEPRDAAKVAERKIRIFTLGPMCFYLLCKKYCGGFMAIYTKNFLETETVGGVNPFSKDWGRVYKRLSKFPNVVNGDFSKFDKKTSTVLLMAAITVMMKVKHHFVTSTEEADKKEYENAMRVIGSEIANPLVLVDGSMMELPGSLSSGVLLTFILNDIVNSLYIRMAYYDCLLKARPDVRLTQAVKSFQENVVFFSLGDDNTYTISDDSLKFFNFISVQAYFKSIGLKYTLADKSDNVYGAMPLEYASIGKRKWVFNTEYQIWMCPIEKPSVMKTLTIGVASDALTPQEHEAACFDSALPELAQYSRKEFDARVATLRALRPFNKFRSYDYYLERQAEDGVTPWVPIVDAEFSDIEWTLN